MAEFAMVIVLLLMLFLGLVSVMLWAYTRTLLTSAAANAARYAANADVNPAVAVQRVGDQLAGGVTNSTLDTLRCTVDIEGLMTGVSCTLEAPGIIGLFDGVMPTISVVGHAAREGGG